jgi:simple sugar transport system permease protein
MLNGAIGSPLAISNVLVSASPLLLTGVGVAIGIKAGLWNIGAEGYMYMGALGAGAVGIVPLPLPPIVHIILALLAGAVVAGLWGLVPAYLRAFKGVNEVVTTIMMNYVAQYFTSWMVHEPQPMAEPGAFFPMSRKLVSSAQLPILMPGSSLHPGFIIGIAACILFYLAIRFTPFGFRTRMLGANPEASRYAGVNVKRQILFVLLIGALMGGVAGAVEVMGLKLRVYQDFVSGAGFEGVAVALLAAGNPLGVIASALFFGVLKAGGAAMSVSTGVGGPMTIVIEALCVIFVIAVGYGERKRLE